MKVRIFSKRFLMPFRDMRPQVIVLKREQRASIKAVYEGKDAFVWLPTRFGKSVCYEALPFVFDFKLRTNAPCLALVISPLDQVVSL